MHPKPRLALALTLLVACAVLAWLVSRAGTARESVPVAVSRIKSEFARKTTSSGVLRFNEIRQSRADPELVDPRLTLPQSHRFKYGEISALYRYASSCRFVDYPARLLFSTDAALKKALAWQDFKCGRKNGLPAGFLNSKPFMHPNGKSYAGLAGLTGDDRRLHLLEVLRAGPFRELGLNVSTGAMQSLLDGQSIVFLPEKVLIAVRANSTVDTVVAYDVYDKKQWDRFVADKSLLLAAVSDSELCLAREGTLCWVANEQQRSVRWLVFALGGLCALLATFLVVGTIQRIRRERRENAQRLFALQMLTHELRTPATALKLSLETLRKDFDALPHKSQSAFLAMCEELQRLERVVDASKNYLSADSDGGLRASNDSVSVGDVLGPMLETYGARVELETPSNGARVRAERYWLELCLRNLIDNALTHGKGPVQVCVETSSDSNSIAIVVRDQGEVPFKSLSEMVRPFQKGAASRGLGLGLSIVARVAESMGGELRFTPSPTTFSIVLRGEK